MAHGEEDKSVRSTAPDAKAYHRHHQINGESSEGANSVAATEQIGTGNAFRRFLGWYKMHKKVSIPATVALVLTFVLAIPFTRYSVLGLFLEQDFSVIVIDSQTDKPVSAAQVTLRGKTASTDGEGRAKMRVSVGTGKLTITKKYYQTSSREIVVPIKKQTSALELKLKAIGRPVPVSVVNGISGKPVSSAVFSAGDSQAETDDKGQAILVVPAADEEVKATLSADGYNALTVTITATTEESESNKFKLTPAGKVYFLSNQSGKIDVVESDLDGGNRKVILAGTGKEVKGETVLLATRDWKYLALLSKRDGGSYAKLFLINTGDGSLTTMDEGEATFSLSGWEEHHFIYRVNRNKLNLWDAKRQALKSYNADTKKITTLDETAVDGNQFDYVFESIDSVYVIDHRILYVKNWSGSYYASFARTNGKEATLNSISPSKENKKIVKAFSLLSPGSYVSLSSRSYGPNELHLLFNAGDKDRFYEYEDGAVKDLPDMKAEEYYNATYATYLTSPSGKKTFWSEDRDGKLAFMTGDAKGESGTRIATLGSEYQTYGWYTDSYLLVSKKGSELYILPAGGVESEDQLFKVTDYYRPFFTYPGYGGGYGGL